MIDGSPLQRGLGGIAASVIYDQKSRVSVVNGLLYPLRKFTEGGHLCSDFCHVGHTDDINLKMAPSSGYIW